MSYVNKSSYEEIFNEWHGGPGRDWYDFVNLVRLNVKPKVVQEKFGIKSPTYNKWRKRALGVNNDSVNSKRV